MKKTLFEILTQLEKEYTNILSFERIKAKIVWKILPTPLFLYTPHQNAYSLYCSLDIS